MYNNFFCKISDIGQKFTIRTLHWLELFKKNRSALKQKAVLALSQELDWNFICFSCNNCLLVVQQGCKYVILTPLHLKVHTMARTGMTVSLAWATATSSCSACSVVEAWEWLSAGSSSSSLSVFGDLRKRLVADTWSANDRDHLKRWLVSNDMAPCRLFAVHSLCPLLWLLLLSYWWEKFRR